MISSDRAAAAMNRRRAGRLACGIVVAISLVRVGMAGLVLLGVASFPTIAPKLTASPGAHLIFNAVWAVAFGVVFVVLRPRDVKGG